MKVVFLGTDNFVDPVLKIIEDNYEVLSVRSPKDFNKEKIKAFSPDLFVVASFGKILTKEILEIPNYGAINIHPSLLPKYRGPSPIQTTIREGDKTTGVTIIKMDEEIDHGPILFQKEEEVFETETFIALAERLFKVAAENLPKTISNYVSSQTNVTVQDDSKATFTPHLTRESGYIDVNNPPAPHEIKRMIRAYYPWPGAWTKYNLGDSEKIIKLLPEGKVQVEGKKEMEYSDFINGYPEGKELLNKLGLS